MQYSTNYNLNLVEGTDIVNPLVIDKPNYQTIDSALKSNKDAAVNSATHTKAGTVHAIVRSNTDADTFRFVASAPFITGDTFTVDGVAVTGINTAGEGLGTNDFVIGASVLCVLNSGTLTLNVNKKVSIPATYDADDIVFNNTGTGLAATDAQAAIEEINARVSKNVMGTPVTLTNNTPYTATFDGYFTLYQTFANTGATMGFIDNVNIVIIAPNGNGNQMYTLFVRKGSVIKYTGTELATFTPLL